VSGFCSFFRVHVHSNTMADVTSKSKGRQRYDRLFSLSLDHPDKEVTRARAARRGREHQGGWQPAQCCMVGTSRIAKTDLFPSDHYGLLVQFEHTEENVAAPHCRSVWVPAKCTLFTGLFPALAFWAVLDRLRTFIGLAPAPTPYRPLIRPLSAGLVSIAPGVHDMPYLGAHGRHPLRVNASHLEVVREEAATHAAGDACYRLQFCFRDQLNAAFLKLYAIMHKQVCEALHLVDEDHSGAAGDTNTEQGLTLCIASFEEQAGAEHALQVAKTNWPEEVVLQVSKHWVTWLSGWLVCGTEVVRR
jgi:hypothetical protein